MKYKETSKFPKFIGSAGFITLAACSLIAIGAATWFLVSRQNNAVTDNMSSNNSSVQNESYNEEPQTYNSVADIPQIEDSDTSTDVANSAEEIPYEPEETETEPQIERSFILPFDGNISKGYSDTALQYSETFGDMRLHTGIDILCDKNSDIKSVASGTVSEIGEDANLGRYIVIDHGDNITVKYCGLASVNVNEGDTVSAESSIGTSGEIPSECGDEPHIHIEVYLSGECVSPLTALGIN